MNPVLAIKDPGNPKSAFTGNKGSFRGLGGSYMPALDPSQIAINYLQPGQKGIPVSTGNNPQDIYEADFAPSDQRNIFRQVFQKRLDLSVRKSFKITEKMNLLYAFNAFNVFNTTSLDVPQNQTQIAQSDGCSSYEETQQQRGQLWVGHRRNRRLARHHDGGPPYLLTGSFNGCANRGPFRDSDRVLGGRGSESTTLEK